MSGHRCLVTNCTCLFIFTPNSTYVCWDSSQPVPASVRNCVKHEAGFASSSLVWGSGTVVVGWLRSGLWRVDILSWFSLWGRHSFSSVLVTFLSHWTSSSTTVTVPIKLFPLLSCVWARISQALCKVSERLLRTYMLGWNKTSAHVISLLRSRRTCWGQAALPHLNGRLIITFSLDQQISPANITVPVFCMFLPLPSVYFEIDHRVLYIEGFHRYKSLKPDSKALSDCLSDHRSSTGSIPTYLPNAWV